MSIEKQERRKPLPIKLIVVASLAVLGIAYYAYSSVKSARVEASTVVARVNGEPIYAADVSRGLSSDSFDSTASGIRQQKLGRLIAQMAIRQYLTKHHVSIPQKRVDAELKRMELNPPSMGCACCTYPSLDNYLKATNYTREDLRQDISNGMALSEYARQEWKKTHTDKAVVMKEIGEQKGFIQRSRVKAWQIFFNTFQKPGFDKDPVGVRKSVGKKAQKAWERLQRGESFANVAKSMSEDMTSNRKGGYLGTIEKSSYGMEVEKAISYLQPGQYSKPIESPWGFHIIKYHAMSDTDVIKFCESFLAEGTYQNLHSQIMKDAKVERLELPDNNG